MKFSNQLKIRVYFGLTALFGVIGVVLALTKAGSSFASLFLVLSLGAGAMWAWAMASRPPAEPTSEDSVTAMEAVATVTRVNPYARFMLLGGVSASVAGAIIALSGFAASQSAVRSNEHLMVMGGLMFFDPDAGAAGTSWMWAGIVLLIIGVVLLVILLSIKAAKSN